MVESGPNLIGNFAELQNLSIRCGSNNIAMTFPSSCRTQKQRVSAVNRAC